MLLVIKAVRLDACRDLVGAHVLRGNAPPRAACQNIGEQANRTRRACVDRNEDLGGRESRCGCMPSAPRTPRRPLLLFGLQLEPLERVRRRRLFLADLRGALDVAEVLVGVLDEVGQVGGVLLGLVLGVPLAALCVLARAVLGVRRALLAALGRALRVLLASALDGRVVA